MPYRFKVRGKIGTLSVELGKPIIDSSAEKYLLRTSRSGMQCFCFKNIFRRSKQRVSLTIIQRFEFVRLATQFLGDLKIAFVTEPSLYDSHDFGEDVAYNGRHPQIPGAGRSDAIA